MVALLELGMNGARYAFGRMQIGFNGMNADFSPLAEGEVGRDDDAGAFVELGTSIYRWQNVAWDDSLLPDSGGSRCVNRDFSDYRII